MYESLINENAINGIVFFIIALISGLALGPIVIPRLKRLKFGQAIREEGPKSHLQKTGTPTMGGFIFLIAFMIPIALTLMFERIDAIFVVLSTFGFGAIGFIDDYLKVVKKQNEGLKSKEKFALQFALSLCFAFFALKFGTDTHIPFLSETVELGWLFFPLMTVMFVAVDNAVNLTDGLDGLSGSVTLVVSLFFLMMGIKQQNPIVISLSAAMSGGLLAYLKYNWHPAKVFMGDTGSLALGGYVGAMAILLKIPLLIPVFGLIYFIETLSVMIQVGVYKKTKKRVFKMAPIHHHYEALGWKEVKIVTVFSTITFIVCMISYFII